ncbi:MAG: hypothetical protein ABI406_04180 [Ktedonobacteraceae bacterium]
METRDLGTHTVELHEHGGLDIIGSGTRITLPAHEAYDLLQWLAKNKGVLHSAAVQQPLQPVPPELQDAAIDDGEDGVDNPIDEP